MKSLITLLIKLTFSILLLSCLFQYAANCQTLNQSTSNELDRYFKETVKTQKYVALGACLIKENKIIWDG
jgi:hypothetical protein